MILMTGVSYVLTLADTDQSFLKNILGKPHKTRGRYINNVLKRGGLILSSKNQKTESVS